MVSKFHGEARVVSHAWKARAHASMPGPENIF